MISEELERGKIELEEDKAEGGKEEGREDTTLLRKTLLPPSHISNYGTVPNQKTL